MNASQVIGAVRDLLDLEGIVCLVFLGGDVVLISGLPRWWRGEDPIEDKRSFFPWVDDAMWKGFARSQLTLVVSVAWILVGLLLFKLIWGDEEAPTAFTGPYFLGFALIAAADLSVTFLGWPKFLIPKRMRLWRATYEERRKDLLRRRRRTRPKSE